MNTTSDSGENLSTIKLPKVVMFYGPPGSGKGTQANMLKELFKTKFLDWGHEFRTFVQNHINDKEDPDYRRAKRVQEYMSEGLPILTEDLEYIISQAIIDGCLKNEGSFVMDRCGVRLPEAEWLSDLLKKNNISSLLFHLPLSLEESIERISNRYYIPNDNKPYKSYQEALNNCPEGVFPIKREDQDRQATMTRYDNLYRKDSAAILDIYKLKGYTQVIDIDASLPILEVHAKIIKFLKEYTRSQNKA